MVSVVLMHISIVFYTLQTTPFIKYSQLSWSDLITVACYILFHLNSFSFMCLVTVRCIWFYPINENKLKEIEIIVLKLFYSSLTTLIHILTSTIPTTIYMRSLKYNFYITCTKTDLNVNGNFLDI